MVPFDALLQRSTVNRAGLLWQSLLRDDGAPLSRRYSLYTLTSGRDCDDFSNNFQQISE